MFDTHCHLNDSIFSDDLNNTIRDARENEVKEFIIPSTNLTDSKMAVTIANTYIGVYAALGIHPTCDIEQVNIDKIFQTFDELIEKNKKIIAIGECGLDYYRFKSPASQQRFLLLRHISLSIKRELPLLIHNRMASDDILKILEEECIRKGFNRIVFHCCPPEKQLLKFAISQSICIGIDGDITYDKNKQDFVKEVPLNLLLLETDSPVLIPEPLKSKKMYPNQPKYLKFIADKIAEIKDIEVSELIAITTRNAHNMFEIK